MIGNLPLATLAITASATTATIMSTTQPVADVRPATALAGLIGAVITILVQKPLGARETLGVAVCGTATALYLTPYVAHWIGVDEERQAMAFLLGMAGIFVCRRLIDLIQDPQHVVDIIRSGKWLDLLKTSPRPVETIAVVTKAVGVDPPQDPPHVSG